MNDGLTIHLPGLPVPPTINHFYGHRGHVRFITEWGKEYVMLTQMQVYDVIKAIPDFKPLTTPVKVYLDIHRARATGDLDNFAKPALDALEGLVYVNDRQIVELHMRRFDDKHNPRADVRVVEVRA